MARHLKLPEEICNQTPSTDTYSLPQTQEEFYFALPYDQMDLLLYAFIHNIPAAKTELDWNPRPYAEGIREVAAGDWWRAKS